MKKTEPEIFQNAFYGNQLSVTRKEDGNAAIATGYYITRHGTVHLYGEKHSNSSTRLFFLDFYYAGRTYRCTFEEWLSDGAIRRRALRFVDRCLALTKPA